MQTARHISRRGFIKGTTGAAAAIGFSYLIRGTAFGQVGATASSEKITLGFVGTGGRGTALLQNFLALKDAQVVAVCDVKRPSREQAKEIVEKHYGTKGCGAYVDFRELCARPDIDAVVVGSTDHWHVLHSLEAVRNGRDVYCEKPLSMSVEQGQVLRREVNRYNRVFQFGTQERSSHNSRFACEMVRSGRIGKVQKITVASRYSIASENFPPTPVPDWIDYDLWLGPAPWVPYTANRVSNSHWFHISDYALGFLAGCGIHTIDIATWGNGTDLTGPVEVEGIGEFPKDGLCDCATGWDVNLKFGNGVLMNFTDGQRNPLGVKFEGTDGWVFVKEEHLGGNVDANPKSIMEKEIGPNEVHLPISSHHQQNFLDCVKSRARTVAPVEAAVRSDALCQLSDIATRLGRKLRWDPDKEQFIGDEQANRMLSRPMRSPWKL
jgi:predicted dehydrogenase